MRGRARRSDREREVSDVRDRPRKLNDIDVTARRRSDAATMARCNAMSVECSSGRGARSRTRGE